MCLMQKGLWSQFSGEKVLGSLAKEGCCCCGSNGVIIQKPAVVTAVAHGVAAAHYHANGMAHSYSKSWRQKH